jgi:hypothetical protein
LSAEVVTGLGLSARKRGASSKKRIACGLMLENSLRVVGLIAHDS